MLKLKCTPRKPTGHEEPDEVTGVVEMEDSRKMGLWWAWYGLWRLEVVWKMRRRERGRCLTLEREGESMLCMSTLVAITYGCIDIYIPQRKHSPFGQLATDWE